MNVAVLASPGDAQPLLKILEALEASGVESYGLKIGSTWDRLGKEQILDKLAKATHYLAIASLETLAAPWFAFAAGYGYGRGSGLVLFRLDADRPLPRYLGGLPVIDTLDELVAYYAAARAEWLVIEEMHSARAALLEMGVSYHADSLSQCVADGDTKAVDLFLRAGFPPGSRDRHGVPLLCLAARGKHLAVAEILLDRGAPIDVQSEDRGYSALMDATHAGSIELIEFFLAREANPDLRSKDGQTALVIAVGRNDADAVRALLHYGADIEIADKLGFNARKYAALFKNPSVQALLGPAGPEPGKA